MCVCNSSTARIHWQNLGQFLKFPTQIHEQGIVVSELRTLAAASWRRRRDAAGLPLALLHLRPQAPLGRYSLSGSFAAALDGVAA